MTPSDISGYITVAQELYAIIDGIIGKLKSHGVTDEQLAAITSDYDARIAAREADLPPAA